MTTDIRYKEKAWHGSGQIVQDYPTSAEAIRFAGLDYSVEKRKLFTYDNENNDGNPNEEIIIPEIEVPNYYATMRTDTEQVLGVVGSATLGKLHLCEILLRITADPGYCSTGNLIAVQSPCHNLFF